jgi:hypothetical protein
MPEKKTKPWYTRWWAIFLYIIIGAYILSLFSNQTPTNGINMNTPSIETNADKVIVQQPQQEEKTVIKEIVSNDKTIEEYMAGNFTKEYKWNYNGNIYQITLNLYPEVYKIFKSRERTRDYDLFASDTFLH